MKTTTFKLLARTAPCTKSKLALWAAGGFISVCIIFHYLPLRNYLLKNVLPGPWRDVTTVSIIKMNYLPQPPLHIKNPDTYTCSSLHKPKMPRTYLKSAALKTYPRLTEPGVRDKVALERHGQFMPVLNVRTKSERLYLYAVLRESLEREGIEHFVTGGVLLGYVRYRSLLPWDDDIDAAVDVRQAEKAQRVLSCVHGFSLHWNKGRRAARFRYHGRTRHGDPFVDVLFFTSDSRYVWAVNSAMSVLHVRSTVFPVNPVSIEGVTFMLPRDPLAAAGRLVELGTCCVVRRHVTPNRSWAYKSGHGTETFRKSCERCTKLEYMYPLTKEGKAL